MLVKAGAAIINASRIDSILIKERIEKIYKKEGGFWSRSKLTGKRAIYDIYLSYADLDGNKKGITLTDFYTWDEVVKTKNELATQAKELENVGATQALEEALRNG